MTHLDADEVLKAIGVCTKCLKHKYCNSQVLLRYYLLNQTPTSVAFSLLKDMNEIMEMWKKRLGCAGCAELRLTSFSCVMIVLRKLKVYDVNSGRSTNT